MEYKPTLQASASPQEVAGRIAALHGSEPSRTPVVKMVGSQEVEQFIALVLDAQEAARDHVLSLD